MYLLLFFPSAVDIMCKGWGWNQTRGRFTQRAEVNSFNTFLLQNPIPSVPYKHLVPNPCCARKRVQHNTHHNNKNNNNNKNKKIYIYIYYFVIVTSLCMPFQWIKSNSKITFLIRHNKPCQVLGVILALISSIFLHFSLPPVGPSTDWRLAQC